MDVPRYVIDEFLFPFLFFFFSNLELNLGSH
jgi:hypothetical protein